MWNLHHRSICHYAFSSLRHESAIILFIPNSKITLPRSRSNLKALSYEHRRSLIRMPPLYINNACTITTSLVFLNNKSTQPQSPSKSGPLIFSVVTFASSLSDQKLPMIQYHFQVRVSTHIAPVTSWYFCNFTPLNCFGSRKASSIEQSVFNFNFE